MQFSTSFAFVDALLWATLFTGIGRSLLVSELSSRPHDEQRKQFKNRAFITLPRPPPIAGAAGDHVIAYGNSPTAGNASGNAAGQGVHHAGGSGLDEAITAGADGGGVETLKEGADVGGVMPNTGKGELVVKGDDAPSTETTEGKVDGTTKDHGEESSDSTMVQTTSYDKAVFEEDISNNGIPVGPCPQTIDRRSLASRAPSGRCRGPLRIDRRVGGRIVSYKVIW